jgi:tetratricopeptide (TPR) repeat protein
MNLRWPNAVTFLLVIFAFAFTQQTSFAQISTRSTNSLPKPAYYQTFPEYWSGDFNRAGRDFQRRYTTAYNFNNTRFLDSVCVLTMIGECHYNSGNYSDALASYEQALTLYLWHNSRNWQGRINVPTTLAPDLAAFQKSRISWGQPTRNTAIAKMPSTFLVMLGDIDADRAYLEGGVVDRARFVPVDVTEIMRCTALALHRRSQILGKINRVDPFSKRLLSGLSVANAGNGSIMGAYNGVLLGIALASVDRDAEALRILTRSLQIKNEFDHALTPMALIELTQIAISAGKRVDATTLALEASYSAGVFRQFDLVSESLALGTTNHLLTHKTPYPPLVNAIAWCNRENVRLPQLSISQRLAECHAEAGNSAAARDAIVLAGRAFRGRNTLGSTVANARLQYAAAVASFTEGNFGNGLKDLAGALAQYQEGSLWLFRLRLVADLVASNSVSELEADKLYSVLLRDPNDADWKLDPIEPMSFLATDHVSAMETWFEILLRRRQYERAVQVAELIRRHRFYSTLPMGGRLLAFRHSLNAEQKSLDVATVQQRDSFLNRNRAYKELLTGTLEIQKELVKLPLAPEPDSEDYRKRRQLLGQLSQVSAMQESLMASYALSREPSNLAFPPQMQMESFQRLIPKGVLCLSTLETASGYHLFFVSRERTRYVHLGSSRGIERAITKLLKDIGAIGSILANQETLESEAWKETANEFKRGIFKDIPDSAFENIVELVVIPDGMFWYMPFEALPIQTGEQEKFLVDLCPIRYAPTMYLSVEAPGGGQLSRNTVAVGSMHSKGEVETTLAEVEELKKKFPELESYQKQTTPSGLSAWLTDHLMVWSESSLPANGFDFQPIPFDVSDHASISSWMALPWYGPEYLSMPGLRTFGRGRKANGSEMFVATVTLMSAGSRTIMLPRWPTGGAISLGLSRLYAEHLSEKQNGARALRRAMIDARDLKFDIEKEPQIKKEKVAGDISPKHPFFWASFFVVDQPRLSVEEDGPGGMMPGGAQVVPGSNKAPGVTAPTPPVSPTPSQGMPKPSDDKSAEANGEKADGEDEAKKSDKPVPEAEEPKEAEKPEKPKRTRPKGGGIF